jgi:uncharacterized membrane protein
LPVFLLSSRSFPFIFGRYYEPDTCAQYPDTKHQIKMEEKNLQLERTVFFCDAVVAIAITLLALNIKIPVTEHLRFADLVKEWKTFAAFSLSFLNIANFWKTHHTFFAHIRKIDEKLLWYNVLWLFFIVLLPFTTSLVSQYFFDTAAVFSYSLNTFLITLFQNNIWDYVSLKPSFLKENTLSKSFIYQVRVYCNLDMINALLALIISFFAPALAFILLFTKLPMTILARIYFSRGKQSIKK